MSITNAEAVKFSNERLRPAADLIAQLYNFGKSVDDEYTARGMNLLIPNDAGEEMQDSAYGTDGTDGDGRPIVSGQDLTRVMVLLIRGFIADLEADDNLKLKLALRVAVNTIK